MMLTIKSEYKVNALDKNNRPNAVCMDGDTVIFETKDCFGNQIESEEMLIDGLDWSNINPATGPLLITGAEKGDILKVEILKIEIDQKGVMIDGPGEGVLKDIIKKPSTRIFEIKDGFVKFNDRLTFPVKPMIGVIGTAPEGDGIPTGTPGPHGGNMDCKKITEGSIVYLPVNTEGALLAMGDLHAVMGDGEVGVCGVETAGRVTVRVKVIKNRELPTPFIVNEKEMMTVYSAVIADEALDKATIRMHEFLTGSLSMNENEANMLLSVSGDAKICQIVDPEKTARFEMPVEIAKAYGYEFP